ncbi:MAG: NAD(P)-binding protein [Luteolibacter sp.]
MPPDDPKVRKPDITRAKEVLHWEPVVEFDDGIARTIEYFRNLMVPPDFRVSDQPNIDFLIVGAGFCLVMAEQLSNAGWKCVIVDKRDHLGGNAHDRYDQRASGFIPTGRIISGPIHRASATSSRFTDWHPVHYTIKSHAAGRHRASPSLIPSRKWIGRPATSEEFEAWLQEHREHFISRELLGSDHFPVGPPALRVVF